MEPVKYVFGFIFIAGVLAHIPLSNVLRFLPANENIDHPAKAWRIFYRLMALLMCNFWSFLLTIALLGTLPVEELLHKMRDSSQLARAIALLVIPLPMLPLLYMLYAKLVRWSARQEAVR
jgi:hypothetical protein